LASTRFDVRLHRGLAQEELVGDLRVGQAARHEAEHLELARRQLGEHRRRSARGRRARELLDQALRDARRDQRVAGRHDADGRDQILRRRVLELDGMRARVAAHGGRLEAGPEPHGGWLLVAELPARVPLAG